MSIETIPFQEFPKIARLSRDILITEKIDGTNAQVFISESGEMLAGSRSRWITPQNDNYGFAAWVEDNREELLKLGPGRHFGEWWGSGCQRGYGLQNGEKRFSLFNAMRWCQVGEIPKPFATNDPRVFKTQNIAPDCCFVVPLLYHGPFSTCAVQDALDGLVKFGSAAAPGFAKPEGVVVYHIAAGVGFKKTIEKDDAPKTLQHK